MRTFALQPGAFATEACDSFEAFYRAQVDIVYRALAVTLGNDDVAREATDEAMLRTFVNWARVRTLESPSGWAFRIGLNWATSRWRRLRREAPLTHANAAASVAEPDPAATAALTAVDRLGLGQRAVVVCRILLDLSTAETAAVLGVAEGTVRSRLARALVELRSELTGDDR